MDSMRNNIGNSIQPSNTLNQKSLPKKLVGGIALTTLIIGGVLARFADPVWLNVTGLLLTGVAALVFWSIR